MSCLLIFMTPWSILHHTHPGCRPCGQSGLQIACGCPKRHPAYLELPIPTGGFVRMVSRRAARPAL